MLTSPPRLQLEPTTRGGLLIWELPKQGRKYVIGVDTAHGLAKGDYAVCAVIDAETCTLVARWREKADPHVWGIKSALLGWFYNEALLAIETFPSAHGVTACMEAMRLGYRNIYKRQTQHTIARKQTDMLGWHTNVATKPMMIDRVKKALEDQSSYIFDEDLLQELRTRSWNAKGQMDGPGNDDIFAAYAIALMVRDQSWVQGKLRPDENLPMDYYSRYWREWEKQVQRKARPKPRRKPWTRRPPVL